MKKHLITNFITDKTKEYIFIILTATIFSIAFFISIIDFFHEK